MEIKGNNEYNNLILRYDDDQREFVDITKDVFYLLETKNSYRIGFSNNGVFYNISKTRIRVSTNPIKLSFNKNNVYINGVKKNDVYNIVKFGYYGYKVFLSSFKTVFVKDIMENDGRIDILNIDIRIKETNTRVFDYYKSLAKYSSDLSDDETSISHLLYDLYEKVTTINGKSVVNYYTNSVASTSNIDSKVRIIYPFATNQSQMNAISNTFNNKLSVISGPPGTGKTQVILNIIASAIFNDMSVAVISNNNAAVENVYDKMKENGFSFLLAYLGNSENVEKFFSISDNLEEEISNIEVEKADEPLDVLINKIKYLYNLVNENIKLKQELYEIEEEFKHFKMQHEYVDFSNVFKGFDDYNNYLSFKYDLLAVKKLGLFQKIKLWFKYKIKASRIESLDKFILYLEYKYLEGKISELKNAYNNQKEYINNNDFDTLSEEIKRISLIYFKNYIAKKYQNQKNCILTKENYKKYFKMFMSRYPVVLSTTHSLLRNMDYSYMFDLIIIDEASQTDILSSILAMNVTKQMVVVGDAKQLSQIDNKDIYVISDQLAYAKQIEKCYKYNDNSILQSFLSLPFGITNTTLREHYRCDSRIIEFCNKKFYDDELIVCTNTSKEDTMFVIHTVEGNHARRNPNGSGQYNDREAQEIIEIIKKCDSKDIGIITPFRAQADYISSLIKKDYPYVEVDTIHKYQGRQKEIIILSTVLNDLKVEEDDFVTDFVTNPKLLNVAISRAVKNLYLVVSDKVYRSSKNTIAQLIDYIRYYNSDNAIEQGHITSIFDKLYDDQNKVLIKSPCNKYVDSYAEEVMLKSLNKVLDCYTNYKIQLHYRLSDLITSFEGLNDDEIKYVNHPKTHVDFVIFDAISYKPVLCIEVDGTKFHDYAKVQIEHDKIKSKVLELNGIALLRLKTNQSGEVEKIKQFL